MEACVQYGKPYASFCVFSNISFNWHFFGNIFHRLSACKAFICGWLNGIFFIGNKYKYCHLKWNNKHTPNLANASIKCFLLFFKKLFEDKKCFWVFRWKSKRFFSELLKTCFLRKLTNKRMSWNLTVWQ